MKKLLLITYAFSPQSTPESILSAKLFANMKNLKTDAISSAFLLTFKYAFGHGRANQFLTSIKDNISDSKLSPPSHAIKKGLFGLPNLNLKYQDVSNSQNYVESFRDLASRKFNKKFNQKSW